MTGYSSIADFKDLHRDKRLFILASGSSINDHDLTHLQRRITMGLNRSFMIYPKTHYHCCMDQRLFELHEDDMKQTRFLFTLEDRPWGIPIKLLGAEGFSWDLEEGVYSGYTISYLALQIAIYMGFQEIFFLGLDLKLHNGNTHFFGKDFHSRNHATTEFPKMKRMLEFAAEQVKDKKVNVYNCSPSTDLTCFPFIDYKEAIER